MQGRAKTHPRPSWFVSRLSWLVPSSWALATSRSCDRGVTIQLKTVLSSFYFRQRQCFLHCLLGKDHAVYQARILPSSVLYVTHRSCPPTVRDPVDPDVSTVLQARVCCTYYCLPGADPTVCRVS